MSDFVFFFVCCVIKIADMKSVGISLESSFQCLSKILCTSSFRECTVLHACMYKNINILTLYITCMCRPFFINKKMHACHKNFT